MTNRSLARKLRYSQPRQRRDSKNALLEQIGDEARFRGSYGEASTHYEKIRQDERFAHYRAALKIATLPLFALAQFSQRNTPIHYSQEDVDAVHAQCGELLEDMTAQYITMTYGTVRSEQLKGIITEVALTTLGARDFNKTERHLLYPADRVEDITKREEFRTDAVDVNLEGLTPVFRSTQIKTSSFHQSPNDSSTLRHLSLNVIARSRVFHDHPSSLTNILVRELNGRATDQEILYLDACQERQYAILTDQPLPQIA